MRVRVPSPRSGSIWKMPPCAQSLLWIFIDRPVPVRPSSIDSRSSWTVIALVSARPRWSGILLAHTTVGAVTMRSRLAAPVNRWSKTAKSLARTVNCWCVPRTMKLSPRLAAGIVVRTRVPVRPFATICTVVALTSW